jgi:hypothetical protein
MLQESPASSFSVISTLKHVSGRVSVKKLRLGLLVMFVFMSMIIQAQVQFGFGSNYKYLKGSAASALAAGWTTDTFDDSGWNSGSAPFRYGDGTGGTLISDMINSYPTVYLRSKFNAFSVDRIKTINFSINYDDGFVIWINGVKVLSRNAPATLTSASLATANHESGVPEVITLDSADIQLVEGENLLCIQGLNVTLNSSDFYFDMGISASLALPEVSDSLEINFDHEAGFYDAPFDLHIGTEASGYRIVYTLDGSNPQTSATAIQGDSPVSVHVDPESTAGRAKTPVFIIRASLAKQGFSPSRPVTKSFIFIDRVLTQAHPGGNWPTSSVNGQVIDLPMDPDVVNDPRYSGVMEESLLEVPTISLVTDNANMFSPSSGIYVNAYGHGEQWERECSVELINPDHSQGFQVNAGVRIRGGASRTGSNPKHAFRLFFRKEYGPGKLVFPLFGDEGAAEFDKVDLRTEQNYSWSKDGERHNTFLRDIFSRDAQREMGQPYTRGRYYHLYLNGMYWGLYQTEERPEADYAESYFGGDREDYDVIKVSVEAWPYFNQATDGTITPWQDLWNKCSRGFSSNADYFALEGKDQNGKPVKNTRVYVDIDNLIDYMMIIFYTGNTDAPVSAFSSNNMPNNYYAIFNRENRGRGFVFIAHDSEHSMFIDPINVNNGLYENRVTINDPVMTAAGVTSFQPQWLHEKLTANPEYRMRFADRASLRFAPGGVFSPEKCLERFRLRKGQIDMSIIAESARWGDAKTVSPRNKLDDWIPELNDIENRLFPVRTQIVVNQMKAAGLYPAIEPPVFKRNSEILAGDVSFTSSAVITFQNPNSGGKIYFTKDGSDPRAIGGAVSASAGTAENNSSMTVTGTTLLKARILDGQVWSALKQISLSDSGEDYASLKVTEVHYHPADLINGTDTVFGTDLEFIELKNTGNSAMNISGVTIDSAVYHMVPEGSVLPPKGFYVAASKPAKFYEYYGMNPSGNFKGNLSNAGEFILINDRSSRKILSFTFSDDYPWPVSADGDGNSLVPVNSLPTGDPNEYGYWKSSVKTGGSPFADDGISTSVRPVPDGTDRGGLRLYPNPATDLLNIHVDEEMYGNIELKIADLHGTAVLVTTIENNSEISLSEAGIAAGVYIVTAENKGIVRRALLVYTPLR